MVAAFRYPNTAEHVVVTGASSGIGAALAETYADQGVRLGLIGRDRARLDAVATACRQRGAVVDEGRLDVTDRAALVAWIGAADDRQPIDLLIANAGITGGRDPQGAFESPDAVRALFEVNYFAAIATVEAVLPAMRARRRGWVALMSSLAGLRGVAGTPTYSASKAALMAWGESMRVSLAADGVGLSVICPGYVETPMSHRVIARKPLKVTAVAAALRIQRGLARRQPVIAFPWILYLGIRMAPLLPSPVVERLIGRFDSRVAPAPPAAEP
jgi:short-subunit dehydrogenase